MFKQFNFSAQNLNLITNRFAEKKIIYTVNPRFCYVKRRQKISDKIQ